MQEKGEERIRQPSCRALGLQRAGFLEVMFVDPSPNCLLAYFQIIHSSHPVNEECLFQSVLQALSVNKHHTSWDSVRVKADCCSGVVCVRSGAGGGRSPGLVSAPWLLPPSHLEFMLLTWMIPSNHCPWLDREEKTTHSMCTGAWERLTFSRTVGLWIESLQGDLCQECGCDQAGLYSPEHIRLKGVQHSGFNVRSN